MGYPKSFLFTSAMPGEGVYFTALKQGIKIAAEGTKAVIVQWEPGVLEDCRSSELEQEQVINLRDCLQAIILETSFSNLKMIKLIPKFNHKFDPDIMLELFQKLTNVADVVLVCAPPVLACADVAGMAASTAGVVLVVRAGKTRLMMLQEAKNLLIQAKARIIGAILSTEDSTDAVFFDETPEPVKVQEAEDASEEETVDVQETLDAMEAEPDESPEPVEAKVAEIDEPQEIEEPADAEPIEENEGAGTFVENVGQEDLEPAADEAPAQSLVWNNTFNEYIQLGFDAKMIGDLELAIKYFSFALALEPPEDLAAMLATDINQMSREMEAAVKRRT